ncbi:hypothetical protein ILUMI_17697, partial [Ignelater luminosus]
MYYINGLLSNVRSVATNFIMYQLILLSVIATVCLASPLPDSGRVVNGTNAKEGEIPYIVSVRVNKTPFCGGSILDRTHILTAAHCVENLPADLITIQYGILRIYQTEENIIQVKSMKMHENYDPSDNYANDIAVLTLASPITLGNSAQLIVLPKQNEAPPAGATAVLAGWGRSATGGSIINHLQRVDLLVYSDADCSKAHGSTVNAIHHLCGGVPEGGKGQCSVS